MGVPHRVPGLLWSCWRGVSAHTPAQHAMRLVQVSAAAPPARVCSRRLRRETLSLAQRPRTRVVSESCLRAAGSLVSPFTPGLNVFACVPGLFHLSVSSLPFAWVVRPFGRPDVSSAYQPFFYFSTTQRSGSLPAAACVRVLCAMRPPLVCGAAPPRSVCLWPAAAASTRGPCAARCCCSPMQRTLDCCLWAGRRGASLELLRTRARAPPKQPPCTCLHTRAASPLACTRRCRGSVRRVAVVCVALVVLASLCRPPFFRFILPPSTTICQAGHGVSGG